jgi:hypothetical protein
MPGWQTDSSGALKLVWTSPDDLLAFVRSTIGPAALEYGFRIVVEPLPKDETLVDRV